MEDTVEQIIADLNDIENRLTNLDPEFRIYMIKNPLYFKQQPIEALIDNIYHELKLPKDHFNSEDIYVIPRIVITYYLANDRHISALSIVKAMKLSGSSGQYYYKRGKQLIETNKNAKNLYITLQKLYG